MIYVDHIHNYYRHSKYKQQNHEITETIVQYVPLYSQESSLSS